jgi:hypothetical protein
MPFLGRCESLPIIIRSRAQLRRPLEAINGLKIAKRDPAWLPLGKLREQSPTRDVAARIESRLHSAAASRRN